MSARIEPWCVQGDGLHWKIVLRCAKNVIDHFWNYVFRRFRLIFKVFNASVEATIENILHENGT